MNNRPKTIFCDIDGTLITHTNPSVIANPHHLAVILDGTLKKLIEWDSKGYYIILVTGRKEGLRKQTEKQLAEAGIFYDQLIMGVGGGTRVLINDFKPNQTEPTAECFCVERDKGINDLNI